jgi:hypothetical protein
MASGLEMMLGQMFKGLGIDPQELMSLADKVGKGVEVIVAQQQAIIQQNRTISDQLARLGAKPLLLPNERDIEHDDGSGSGPGGGSDDQRGTGGYGSGRNFG